MNDEIIVIIDKLPPSLKEQRIFLKYNKKEISLAQLGQQSQVKEELKAKRK